MPADFLTQADKGIEINATLLVMLSHLSDPKSNVPAAVILDVKNRVRQSQKYINDIANTRIGFDNIITNVEDQDKVALIHRAVLDMQAIAKRRLGTDVQNLELQVLPKRILNEVTGKEYKLLATVKSSKDTYYLAVNDQGQHVFSTTAYWRDVV